VDVQNECISPHFQPKVLSSRIPEFPVIPKMLSTQRHRFLYCVGSHLEFNQSPTVKKSGPAGSIMKIDTVDPEKNEVFAFESFEFPGEVSFVPKVNKDILEPGHEDHGYLIVLIVNGREKTSELQIFDVEGEGSLEKGPISKTLLPTFIPHGLHGSFVEGVTYDFAPFSK